MLSVRLQATPWASGGSADPSNASGRRALISQGPCRSKFWPTMPASARLGNNRVYAQVRIPTAEFQAATLANLAGKDPAAIPFYQNIFSLYNGVHGSQVGTGSCSTLSVLTLAGPCFNRLQTTQNNFTHEYQMSLRIDQKFSDKDSLFGRVQTDQGVQATFTDPINPAFNTQSTQPEYQGQLSETHLFGSNAVNEFKLSGQWYTAFFDNPDRQAALSLFPTTLAFSGGFSRSMKVGLTSGSRNERKLSKRRPPR